MPLDLVGYPYRCKVCLGVRLMDPDTRKAFVLVSAEIYERLLVDAQDRREQAGCRLQPERVPL